MSPVFSRLVRLNCPFIPNDLDELNLQAYVTNLLVQSNDSRLRIILWLLAQVEAKLIPNDSSVLRSTFELFNNSLQAEANDQTRSIIENKLNESAAMCAQFGLARTDQTVSFLHGLSKSYETTKKFVATLTDVLLIDQKSDSQPRDKTKLEQSCGLLDNLAAMRAPTRISNALTSKFYEKAVLARASKSVREAVEKRAVLLENGFTTVASTSTKLPTLSPKAQRSGVNNSYNLEASYRSVVASCPPRGPHRDSSRDRREGPDSREPGKDEASLQALELVVNDMCCRTATIQESLASQTMLELSEKLESSEKKMSTLPSIDENAVRRANARFESWLNASLMIESTRAEFKALASALGNVQLAEVEGAVSKLSNVGDTLSV